MSTTPPSASGPDPDEMSYEQAVEELEAIIERIEQGEVGVEESLAQWKRGHALLKRCRAVLDHADQQLQTMSLDDLALDAFDEQNPGDGSATTD